MVILDQLEYMSAAEASSQPVVDGIVRSSNYTATMLIGTHGYQRNFTFFHISGII